MIFASSIPLSNSTVLVLKAVTCSYIVTTPHPNLFTNLRATANGFNGTCASGFTALNSSLSSTIPSFSACLHPPNDSDCVNEVYPTFDGYMQ